MELRDIYLFDNKRMRVGIANYLYELLDQRTIGSSISHREMPTMEQHVAFIASKPYMAWYIVVNDQNFVVGSVYLTKQNEIGVFINRKFQGQGLGPEAIDKLMRLHAPARYLANINPKNLRSIKMFESIGFKHIQNTYELRHG